MQTSTRLITVDGRRYWQLRWTDDADQRKTMSLGRDYVNSQGAHGSLRSVDAERLEAAAQSAVACGHTIREAVERARVELVAELALDGIYDIPSDEFTRQAEAGELDAFAAALPPGATRAPDGCVVPPRCRYAGAGVVVRTADGRRMAAGDARYIEAANRWVWATNIADVPDGWTVIDQMTHVPVGAAQPVLADPGLVLHLRGYDRCVRFADCVVGFERGMAVYGHLLELNGYKP